MTLHIRKSSGLIVLFIVLIAAFGCQSKKKAMQASNAAAEKARIEREQTEKKLKEEELAMQEVKEKANREAVERERMKQNENKSSTPAVKLDQYFNSIATSSNAGSANASINEALTLFASPGALVLIVISDTNGEKDYDKPTNIKDYLNYVKDQKKNMNAISNLKTDSNGKITELELRKN